MRKILFTLLAMAALGAAAATDYGIQVNGTSVKSDNLSFSTGGGTVSYNTSSNTLTLSSVYFSRSGEAIKVSSNSNRSSSTLKIVFSGTCRAVSTGNNGVVIEGHVDFTINGSTTLGTTSGGKSAVLVKNDATASFYGSSYLYIAANDGYAISGNGGDEWAFFKLTQCDLAGQRGNFYNLDRVCVYPVTTSGSKSTTITLFPTKSSSYPHAKNVNYWELGTNVHVDLSTGASASTSSLTASSNYVNSYVFTDEHDDTSLTKVGNFMYDTYTYNGETYARICAPTIAYKQTIPKTVEIPGCVTLNGTKRHVALGTDALKGLDSVEYVSLNYGVGYISTAGLRGLKNLRRVYIPSSVKFIGNNILYNSGSSNSYVAVYWANLEPGSVTMSDNAFYGCLASTREVVMPTRPAITKAKNLSKVTNYFTVLTTPDPAYARDFNYSGKYYVVTTAPTSSASGGAALVGASPSSVSVYTSYIGTDEYFSNPYIYCTSVAEQAFMYNTTIKTFSCTHTNVTIEKDAFAYCDYLTSVSVYAKCIKEEAFYDCTSLTSITLNEGVQEIHSRAFLGTPITTLNIPSTLTLFAVTAVSGCKKLEKFTVASGSSYFSTYSTYGALYDKAQTKLIKQPANNSYTAVGAFPSTMTTVNDYAFADNCRTAWIELPYGVTTLGSSGGGHIFDGATSVQSIKIPSSVTYISYTNTFYGCTSLKQLLISTTASRTNATTYTFYNVPSTMRVYVPAHWDPYSSSAPYYTDAVWKDYNVIYGAWDVLVGGLPYFINSDKTTACLERGNNISYGGTDYNLSKSGALVIPSAISYNGKNYTVTGLSRYAFMHNTAITSVDIPAAVNYIGDYAFDGCTELKTVNWNVKELPYSSSLSPFYGLTGITSFVFGNTVIKVPVSICRNLTGVTTVTVGENVTSVGENAFNGCSGLTTVNWNAKACNDFSDNAHAPFADNSQITNFNFGSNVTKIPARLCYNLTRLSNVTLPSSLTTIGDCAFLSCSGLLSITIPASVTTVGSGAFWSCTGLRTVNWNATACADIPTNNTQPFSDCTNISTFNFGDNVTAVPGQVCANLSGLTSVTIPAGVTHIGAFAFNGCTGLANIYPKMTAPASLSYGNGIFTNVDKQTCKLTVPAGTLAKYKATDPWSEFYNIVQEGGLPGDLNGDGFVNTGDVSALYQAIVSGSTDALYDLNGDGNVNTGDVSMLYSLIIAG